MSEASKLILAVIRFLEKQGVEIKAGEMFTPGDGSYLYLALLNVRMVNGDVVIIERGSDEHGQR